jgi:hypothetical protein
VVLVKTVQVLPGQVVPELLGKVTLEELPLLEAPHILVREVAEQVQ